MLVLRATKGSPLTYDELDDNFEYLEALVPAPITVNHVPFQTSTGFQAGNISFKGGNPAKLMISGLPTYANDTQAGLAGLTTGELYMISGAIGLQLMVKI